MQGAYNPLFAALVGDAINSNSNFEELNRRQLIDYYLSGSDRLPWDYSEKEEKNAITEKLLASYFIAVATARGEMKYEDLIKVARNFESAPKHFRGVKKICQKIISEKNKDQLNSFKPDILGESFFLKFLQFLEESPEYQEEFWQIFVAGNEDTQAKDALEFIAFIQRLTRNLLNDDQKDIETQALWNTLLKFMKPSDFENSEPLKWAVTTGLIDLVGAIKHRFPKKEIAILLSKIDPTILYHGKYELTFKDAVLHFMRYFELISKFNEIPPQLSMEVFALFDLFTIEDIKYIEEFAPLKTQKTTPLTIASNHGFNNVVTALVTPTEAENDLHNKSKYLLQRDEEICRALTVASGSGHTETVRLLLDKGANIEAADVLGFTAFINAT